MMDDDWFRMIDAEAIDGPWSRARLARLGCCSFVIESVWAERKMLLEKDGIRQTWVEAAAQQERKRRMTMAAMASATEAAEGGDACTPKDDAGEINTPSRQHARERLSGFYN